MLVNKKHTKGGIPFSNAHMSYDFYAIETLQGWYEGVETDFMEVSDTDEDFIQLHLDGVIPYEIPSADVEADVSVEDFMEGKR